MRGESCSWGSLSFFDRLCHTQWFTEPWQQHPRNWCVRIIRWIYDTMATQPYPHIKYYIICAHIVFDLLTHSVINFQFGTRSPTRRCKCVCADLCFPMMMWGLRGSLRRRGESMSIWRYLHVFSFVYTTPSSTTTTTNKRQGKYLAYHTPSLSLPPPRNLQKQQQIKKATRWLMNYSLSRDARNPKVKTSLVSLRFITQILYRTQ